MIWSKGIMAGVLKRVIGSGKEGVKKTIHNVEKGVDKKLELYRRRLLHTVAEMTLYIVGVISVLIGLALALGKIFPIDVVLMVGGGIIICIGLMLSVMGRKK
jgi:hypothetical protein